VIHLGAAARAERTGAAPLSAFGYDCVPGNLARALTLAAADSAGASGGGRLLRAREHPEGADRQYLRIGSRRAVRARIRLPRRPYRTERTAAHVISFKTTADQGDLLNRLIGALCAAQDPAPGRGDRQHLRSGTAHQVGVYLGWSGRVTRLVHYGLALAISLDRGSGRPRTSMASPS
jgi:hypothetical protein